VTASFGQNLANRLPIGVFNGNPNSAAIVGATSVLLIKSTVTPGRIPAPQATNAACMSS